jgi:hypothetical protein
MHFTTPLSLITLLLATTSLANPIVAPAAEPESVPQTLHLAPRAADPDAETFPQTMHFASREANPDPDLVARAACSSTACKTLLTGASCIFASTRNPIKLVKCLADAGGVDSVSHNSSAKFEEMANAECCRSVRVWHVSRSRLAAS